MDYKVISADTHLDLTWLPGDMFTNAAPERLRSKMPYVKETDAGRRWIVEEEDIARAGGFLAYVPGHSKHMDRMAEVGFYDEVDQGIYHPVVADLRIKDQGIDGVDAEVIYGILGIAGGGFSGPGFKDPEVTTSIYDIYNEWIAEFTKASPDRLGALACIISHDPKLAAQQLRRAADIGLRGAEINVSMMAKPMYHKDWDVLWATSHECRIPISFHALGISHRRPEPEEQEEYYYVEDGVRECLFQLAGAEFLLSAVFSGACQRYPDFKFVLGECGIGWIPYIIERMDAEYDDRYHPIGLDMKPTEYWRRQGYSTFQNEHVSMDEVDRIGVDSIMWGSDYPHRDGVFPDSLQAIEKGMGHLPREIRQKIVCDNAARLYKFS
ncbi:MAG: amidohydrolase [Chloroflexi bacterium]|nr:amidohydrolase [Chloroflexota bacterium]